MPRAPRVSSWAPISSSRSRICRLKEGCDVCSLIFAATVRLSASATATKYRRWRSSTSPLMPQRHGSPAYKVSIHPASAASDFPTEKQSAALARQEKRNVQETGREGRTGHRWLAWDRGRDRQTPRRGWSECRHHLHQG